MTTGSDFHNFSLIFTTGARPHSSTTLNMSTTTTDNPISTTLHRAAQADHLRDYEVHLTSDGTTPAEPNTDNRPSPPAVSSLPGWDDGHRGVPPYRPINRNLDMSQRPWGGNPVGDAFVLTMFTGVFTLAVSVIELHGQQYCVDICVIESQPTLEEYRW